MNRENYKAVKIYQDEVFIIQKDEDNDLIKIPVRCPMKDERCTDKCAAFFIKKVDVNGYNIHCTACRMMTGNQIFGEIIKE